jgi:hypothetical protein
MSKQPVAITDKNDILELKVVMEQQAEFIRVLTKVLETLTQINDTTRKTNEYFTGKEGIQKDLLITVDSVKVDNEKQGDSVVWRIVGVTSLVAIIFATISSIFANSQRNELTNEVKALREEVRAQIHVENGKAKSAEIGEQQK